MRARAPKYGAVSWGQDVKKSEFLQYFQVRVIFFSRELQYRCIHDFSESEANRSAPVRIPFAQEYHPALQRLLEAAPEDGWKAFAMYGGPRLEQIISGGNVALVGDSSHRKSTSPNSAVAITTRPSSFSLLEPIFDSSERPYRQLD